MNVAEALEKSPVLVRRDNCVAVRNRNSTCRRCVSACHANAIDVCGNEVTLSASLCTACGACAAACPTEALVPVEPSNAQVLHSATAAMEASDDTALVACARISSKRLADPASYVELPCLSRFDEVTALSLAVLGAKRILLVDGDCSTCKFGECIAHADAAAEYANELLAAQGSAVRVERQTGFPEDVLVENPEGLFGTTRRGFFSEAVGAAKETAMTAARTTVAQELGLDAPEASIGERLRVTGDGTLPLVQTPRHEAAINAFYALGEPCVEAIESRLFGNVTVDATKCNSCNMCAVFCPTGAMRRGDEGGVGAPATLLEFSASSCVQCGLCVDVCWKGAVAMDSRVSLDQLFDFEPVTFNLKPEKQRSRSMFG